MVFEVACGIVLAWLVIQFWPQLLAFSLAALLIALAVGLAAGVVWGAVLIVEAVGFSDYLTYKITKAILVIAGVGLASFLYALFTGRSITESSRQKDDSHQS